MSNQSGVEMIFAQMERELVPVEPLKMPHGLLYHYTDAVGLDGILRNGVVYATHCRFMNDRTELDEGRGVVLQACRELEADQTLSEQHRALVHDFRISFDSPAIDEATRDIFISSFSEKGDDLGQWRAYGHHGAGYAIGVRFDVGKDSAEPTDKVLGFLLPCEYERAKALGDFKADLLDVLRKLERYAHAYHQQTGIQGMWTRGMVMALRRLARHWLSIKNWHFRDEAEWRLIAMPSTKKRKEQIHTRPAGGRGTIPFMKIVLDPHKPPPLEVEQIIVGPTHDPASGVLAVRLLLESLGYDPGHAERIVVPSAIPFRG